MLPTAKVEGGGGGAMETRDGVCSRNNFGLMLAAGDTCRDVRAISEILALRNAFCWRVCGSSTATVLRHKVWRHSGRTWGKAGPLDMKHRATWALSIHYYWL